MDNKDTKDLDNKSLFDTDNKLFNTDEFEKVSNTEEFSPNDEDLFQTEEVVTNKSEKPDYEDLVEDTGDILDDQNENKIDKEKLKKYALIAGGILLAVLIIGYFWGVIYFKSHYLPNTVINGVEVDYLSEEEALEKIDKDYEEREVTIKGIDGTTNTVTGYQIDLNFNNNMGDLDKVLKAQNTWEWPIELIDHTDDDFATDYTYNQDLLDQVVSNLPLVNGPNVVAPVNAYISYNGSEFVINPAVDGNKPDVDKLIPEVLETLVYNDKNISLQAQDLYLKPEITADDATLQADLQDLNTAINASITLTFPTQNVVLNKDTFASWLNLDNYKVVIDEASIRNYVASLANQFDTVNKELSFTTTNGTHLLFTTNSGWELNQAAEINQLKQQILAGSVVTEDPTWAQKGNSFITGNSIGGTYIEVSLNAQTIWYYKNNTRISSSTIVSGDVQDNQKTPTGLYSLLSKNTNVSQQVKYPDGSIQTVTLNYWLPFSNNYGIEGSPWRTEYGGNIYRTQGTDGDIDVPDSMAQTLFSNCDVGTPVVIY